MPEQTKFKKKLVISGILGGIGLAYPLLLCRYSFGIPCIFHLVTGLDCPGCGITRMFLSLLKGDVRMAFFYHPIVFLSLPFLFYEVVGPYLSWLKGTRKPLRKGEEGLLLFFLFLLLGYNIYRNFLEIL